MSDRHTLRIAVALLVLIWIAVVPPPFADWRIGDSTVYTWWPFGADALTWWPSGELQFPWQSFVAR